MSHTQIFKMFPAVLIALLVVLIPGKSPAWEIKPFQIRNENPFIRIFGLPTPAEAWTTPGGRLETGLS